MQCLTITYFNWWNQAQNDTRALEGTQLEAKKHETSVWSASPQRLCHFFAVGNFAHFNTFRYQYLHIIMRDQQHKPSVATLACNEWMCCRRE